MKNRDIRIDAKSSVALYLQTDNREHLLSLYPDGGFTDLVHDGYTEVQLTLFMLTHILKGEEKTEINTKQGFVTLLKAADQPRAELENNGRLLLSIIDGLWFPGDPPNDEEVVNTCSAEPLSLEDEQQELGERLKRLERKVKILLASIS